MGTLIAGGIFMVYLGQYREYQTMVAIEEHMDLETQDKLVNLRFENIVSDTLFLTNLGCLMNAFETDDYSGVKREFRSFLAAKPIYGQLRFIDKNGMEIVRVNSGNGSVRSVPADELQDKSGRYYVREALELPRGEIYVSPLDLNVEQGVVEEPIVPMIRFVSPVFSGNDMRGLIVINYYAAPMLEELEFLGARKLGHFLLLNPDGYYIASPDDEEEWGFMYPDRNLDRYSLNEPERWKQISANETYQYESPSGIISSRIIRPLAGLGINDGAYYWIAVNIIPEYQLEENARPLMFRLFMLGAFLFLLSAIPAWSISQTVIRRRRMRRELYKSANYDELTSLPNRHLFIDRLEQALNQARRFKHKGALLFIDLDRFKAVNDKHGHETGDEMLRMVGERLNAGIRKSDTAARFGGDEFVVLIPVEQEQKGVEILASKLIKVISRPYRLTGVEVSVGASIGIRIFSGESGDSNESPESIINDADTAMYKAKSAGKGRFSIY